MPPHRVPNDLVVADFPSSSEIINIPGIGNLITWGTTVPADGGAVYAPGCLFYLVSVRALINNEKPSLYFNRGTALSCEFVEESGAYSQIDGDLLFDDDFLGDWPAAATVLPLGTNNPWLKVETLGLGITDSDEANGVKKFAFDAVAEAATAALYMVNSPFDIDKNPVFECILAIYDIGDDATLDFNWGLASDTHATDFDSIATFAAFHMDSPGLSVLCHSDDGTTDTAPVDTLVDLVDNTMATFKIDVSDKTKVKFFINGVRVLASTTFDISAYTGALTPIVHVEKTSNNTTMELRLDRIRVRGERN